MSAFKDISLRFNARASRKHGAKHWIMQRVSALLLLPALSFLVFKFLCVASEHHPASALFGSPVGTSLGVLVFGAGLYHAGLGMQVIYEDYVQCPCLRRALIIGTALLNIVVFVFVCVALIRLATGSAGPVIV